MGLYSKFLILDPNLLSRDPLSKNYLNSVEAMVGKGINVDIKKLSNADKDVAQQNFNLMRIVVH